jgi:hypothetical protein
MKTKFFGVNEIYATGIGDDGFYYLNMNVQSTTKKTNENIMLILDKNQIKQINSHTNSYGIRTINNWIIKNDKMINNTYKLYKKSKISQKLPYLPLIGFSLMTFESFYKDDELQKLNK